MGALKSISIKLPEATMARLRKEAQETGRSIAALVRERVEAPADRDGASVYAVTADLAGSVAGSRRPASNQRRRFKRS